MACDKNVPKSQTRRDAVNLHVASELALYSDELFVGAT
jgi:hypothetical protein